MRPGSAGGLHRSAMQMSQFLDQREPDAGAFMSTAVLALDPVESLE